MTEKSKSPTKPITFQADKVQQQQIAELIEKLGVRTQTNVIRLALAELYKKELPAYIYDRSAKDKEKRKEVKSANEFKEMSDQEYASTVEGAALAKTRGGEARILLIGLNKNIQVLPVNGLKGILEDEAVKTWFHVHNEMLKIGKKIGDNYEAMAEELLSDYDIDIHNQNAETEINSKRADS